MQQRHILEKINEAASVYASVKQIVTREEDGRRESHDNTALEQDRPLGVSAKEDLASPVCSLCQGENY